MIAIRIIYKLIRLMEANTTTSQLAVSVVFGMFLGVWGPSTLQWWCGAGAIFLINVNLPLLLTSWSLWALIANGLTPTFQKFGFYLLNSQRLIPIWAKLYHLPIAPYTRFYKTTSLGELVFALAICWPLYWLAQMSIEWLRPFVYHTWRTTKLYRLYVFYKPYTR